MRLARILGAVGRFLITTGVVLLLFVGYQLWGTGLQYAAAQDDLENEFAELQEIDAPSNDGLQALEEISTSRLTNIQLADPNDPAFAGTPDLLARITEEDRAFIDALYQPDGGSIGRISIDKIGLDTFYVEGVRVADLRKGPGHYGNTPLPGQPGNAAIAGHRTTYGAPFHRIDELDPGDIIEVNTLQGTFQYAVTAQTTSDGEEKGHFIVSPSDTQVLDDFGDNRLTLTACHPKYSARQRIIVVAELVDEPMAALPKPEELAELEQQAAELAGEPVEETDVGLADEELPDQAEVDAAQTVAETDFGEGLNGDRDAIPPAVSWGLAAIVLWFTAGFVGRRWKFFTSYAIALIPTLALLWMAFVHIDQAIPSY